MIRVSLVCFSTAETTLRLDSHGQGFLISSSMFVASVIDLPFDILVCMYVRLVLRTNTKTTLVILTI